MNLFDSFGRASFPLSRTIIEDLIVLAPQVCIVPRISVIQVQVVSPLKAAVRLLVVEHPQAAIDPAHDHNIV